MSNCRPIPTLSQSQITAFWEKVEVRGENECWIWTEYRDANGYGRVQLYPDVFLAHRIAYAILRRKPGRLCVCHSCDNPPCCNPNHHFLGTKLKNVRDMDQKGRRASAPCKGAANGNAKLTGEVVQAIRQAADGKTRYGLMLRLAKKYGIHRSTIHRILKHETWDG